MTSSLLLRLPRFPPQLGRGGGRRASEEGRGPGGAARRGGGKRLAGSVGRKARPVRKRATVVGPSSRDFGETWVDLRDTGGRAGRLGEEGSGRPAFAEVAEEWIQADVAAARASGCRLLCIPFGSAGTWRRAGRAAGAGEGWETRFDSDARAANAGRSVGVPGLGGLSGRGCAGRIAKRVPRAAQGHREPAPSGKEPAARRLQALPAGPGAQTRGLRRRLWRGSLPGPRLPASPPYALSAAGKPPRQQGRYPHAGRNAAPLAAGRGRSRGNLVPAGGEWRSGSRHLLLQNQNFLLLKR